MSAEPRLPGPLWLALRPAAPARTWLHTLFSGLAQEAGARDAKALAQQLVLL